MNKLMLVVANAPPKEIKTGSLPDCISEMCERAKSAKIVCEDMGWPYDFRLDSSIGGTVRINEDFLHYVIFDK